MPSQNNCETCLGTPNVKKYVVLKVLILEKSLKEGNGSQSLLLQDSVVSKWQYTKNIPKKTTLLCITFGTFALICGISY